MIFYTSKFFSYNIYLYFNYFYVCFKSFSLMSEVLNVNINEDARLLFEKHDVETIKKIKECAISEIEHKKNVLRHFIGDNYKPVLNTPPVLKEIQSIFDNTKNSLAKISKYSKDINSNEDIKSSEQISPFSEASQLYMMALNCLENNMFVESINNYQNAKLKISSQPETSYVTLSLRTVIDSLPNRIISTIKKYLENPQNQISSDILADCHSTLINFNKITRSSPVIPFDFIKNALVQRTKLLFTQIENIQDICQDFLYLLESSIVFLSTINEDAADFIDNLTNTFSLANIPQNSKVELREIFRCAKIIEDSARIKLNAPNIISFLNEMSISSDFWHSAFLPVFKKLSTSSLKNSIINLKIEEKIVEILASKSLEGFNAIKFALNDQETLKMRALGLPPIITEFKNSLENTTLVLSSQLQSQITQIASIDMLRSPLNEIITQCCKILKSSLSGASNSPETPFKVYHICGGLASPSILLILTENSQASRSIKELLRIQEKAAQEWSSSVANKYADQYLNKVPSAGTAFTFLSSLEKAILAASGHNNTQVCAKNMRNESRKVIADRFKKILDGLSLQGGSEARSLAEAKATELFKSYCLFDIVLSMQSASVDLRASFIEKMDPVKFHSLEMEFTNDAKAVLSSSCELVKLLSGGKIFKAGLPKKVDINAKIDAMFARKA